MTIGWKKEEREVCRNPLPINVVCALWRLVVKRLFTGMGDNLSIWSSMEVWDGRLFSFSEPMEHSRTAESRWGSNFSASDGPFSVLSTLRVTGLSECRRCCRLLVTTEEEDDWDVAPLVRLRCLFKVTRIGVSGGLGSALSTYCTSCTCPQVPSPILSSMIWQEHDPEDVTERAGCMGGSALRVSSFIWAPAVGSCDSSTASSTIGGSSG